MASRDQDSTSKLLLEQDEVEWPCLRKKKPFLIQSRRLHLKNRKRKDRLYHEKRKKTGLLALQDREKLRRLWPDQKCAGRVLRHKLYELAFEQNDWEAVLELAITEENVWKKKDMLVKAMEHQQAACAAGIFKHGVNLLGERYSTPLYKVISCQLLEQFEQFQSNDPQEMVNNPCCIFAAELLTLCDKKGLVAEVLDKATGNKCWRLLYVLINVGLSTKQLEDVALCATYHNNWCFAAFAVKMGCESEDVVHDFFQQKKANFLVDLFRNSSLPIALKLKVLLSAIVHNNSNIAKEMLQKCTDLEGGQLIELVYEEVGGLLLQEREYKQILRRVLCTIIMAGRVDIICGFFQGRDTFGRFVSVRFVIQITVETKSWKMLPSIIVVLHCAYENTKRKALVMLVSQVLKDPKLIAVFAPSMDSWFQLVEFGDLKDIFSELVCRNSTVKKNLSKVSELSTWCLEHSHFYIALFLEFLACFLNTSSWTVELVRSAGCTLAPTSSMWSLLEKVTVMTSESQAFATWAAFVRFYPFDYSLRCSEFRSLCWDLLHRTRSCNKPLVPACQESGAWDWALFYFSNLHDVSVELLLDMLERQVPLSQAALDFSFEQFMKSRYDDGESELKRQIAAGLLSRYRIGRESVLSALAWLVSHSDMEVIETVLDNLDPCSLDEEGKSTMLASLHMVDRRTLLHKMGSLHSGMSEVLQLQFGYACIGRGLSCHQRNLEIFTETTYWSECLLSESLSQPRFVQVLLESGAISHKALSSFCLSNKSAMEEALEDISQKADNNKECRKRSYRLIQEAASQPLTLKQLARMAASSAVRCYPGRKERVKSLPVPHFFQRWINFEDVTTCWLPRKERVVCRFSTDPDSPSVIQGFVDFPAIDFMVEQRIFVVGFGLFGSCYGGTISNPVRIEIRQERTMVGCNDTRFQCDGSASTFRVEFKEPVEILPRIKYTAKVEYYGGETYLGTGGLSTVTCDNVTFHFTDNADFIYNINTSVEKGQIPEIIFFT